MKKINKLLIGLSFMGLLLTGCATHGGDPTVTPEPSGDGNVLNGITQSLYLKAKAAGYEGTYEEWLQTIKGADGSTILVGSVKPNAQQGKSGDIYVDYEAWDIYTKVGDNWVKVGNILGRDGVDGEDGLTPFIGENGNWWIGNTDTGVKAEGKDGKDGKDGEDGDGKTPFIGANGNWWIGDVDTGVPARGPQGDPGLPGQPGQDGKDGQTAWGNTIIPSANGFVTVDVGSALEGELVTFYAYAEEGYYLEDLYLNNVSYIEEFDYTTNSLTVPMVKNGYVVMAKFALDVPPVIKEFPKEAVLTFYASNGLFLNDIASYEVSNPNATFEIDDEFENDLFVYVNKTTHEEMVAYKDALVETGWVVVAEQNEDYILALPGEIGYICLVDFEDYVGIQFYTGDPYVNNHWADLTALIAEYVTEEAIPEYTFGGVVDEEYLGYFSKYIENYGYTVAFINGASLEDVDNYLATLIAAGWDVLGTQAISPEETVLFEFNTSHVADEEGYVTLLIQPLAGEADPKVEAVGEVLGINPFFFGYDSSYGLYFLDIYVDTEAVEMQAALAKSALLYSDLGLELVKEQAGDVIIYGMHNDYMEVTVYGVIAKGLVEITIADYVLEPEDNGLVAATEVAFGLQEGGLTWDAKYEEFWTDIYPEVETIDEAYKIALAAIETLKADFDLVLVDDKSKAGQYYYVTWECKAGYIAVYVGTNNGSVIIEPSVGLYEPVDDRIPQFVLDLGEALYVEFSPLDGEFTSFLAFDDEFKDMDEDYAEYMITNYVIDCVAELGFLPVDADKPVHAEQVEDGVVYYAELQDALGNTLVAIYRYDNEGVTEGMEYFVSVAATQIPERVNEFFVNFFGEDIEIEDLGNDVYVMFEEFPYTEEDFIVAATEETYGFINILEKYFGFKLVEKNIKTTGEGGKSYAYMFENELGDKLMAVAEFTSLGGCVNDQIVWAYLFNSSEIPTIPDEVTTFFTGMFGEEAEIITYDEMLFGVDEEFPYTVEDFIVAATDEEYGFTVILETYFGFKLVEKAITPTEEGRTAYSFVFKNAEGRTIVVSAEFTSLGGCVGDTIHWLYALTENEPTVIPDEVVEFFTGMFGEDIEIKDLGKDTYVMYEEFPYTEEDFIVAATDEEYGFITILEKYFGFKLVDKYEEGLEDGGKIIAFFFENEEGHTLTVGAQFTSLGGVVGDAVHWVYSLTEKEPVVIPEKVSTFFATFLGDVEIKPTDDSTFITSEEFPYTEEDLIVAATDEDYGFITILEKYFGFELVEKYVTQTQDGGNEYVYYFQNADGDMVGAFAATTSLGGVVNDQIVWIYAIAPEIPETLQYLINNFWGEGAIEFKFNGMGFIGYELADYAEEDLIQAFEYENYGIIDILETYFGFKLVNSSVTDAEEGGHVYEYTFQDANGNLLIAVAETTSLGGIVGDHITWMFVEP